MANPFDNVPAEPDKFLKWILGALIILFFIWLLTGGYSRFEDKNKPFLKPPDPLDSGEPYGLDTTKTN